MSHSPAPGNPPTEDMDGVPDCPVDEEYTPHPGQSGTLTGNS